MKALDKNGYNLLIPTFSCKGHSDPKKLRKGNLYYIKALGGESYASCVVEKIDSKNKFKIIGVPDSDKFNLCFIDQVIEINSRPEFLQVAKISDNKYIFVGNFENEPYI